MISEFTKTCRTCLKQEEDVINLKPIFGEAQTLVEIPKELSMMKLKLCKDDGLPQSICNECVDCLTYVYSFRKLCEQSQTTLQQFDYNPNEKLLSIEITKQSDIDLGNVDYLQDIKCEPATPEKLDIELEEENLSDGITCQDDLVELESSSEENRNHLLDTHIKSHPDKNRMHTCPICEKNFATAQNRNVHMESHNENCAYKCDICDSEFKCKNYLAKHKRAIHTIEEHECPHCFMKFNNTNKYKYHLKTHDPNKKYKCKYCDKSFLQQHHLSNHERVHTGLRPYLCNICGKDFRQEHNFTLHLRTHNGDRPYVCTLCGKDFAQRGSFILHKRQHAGIRPYQCEHCGKNFYQKSSLNVHLRTHTGERPFKCDLCKKSFVQSPQLKYHKISIHGGQTSIPKKTKIFKIGTFSESELSVEVDPALIKSEKNVEITRETTESTKEANTSTKHYLFKCSLCIREFKLPSSLASHMKIHSEERKHLCTECGNSFKRAEHLRIHINGVHLKQKPYSCEICQKTFSQAGDRNIHMSAHTGEKPHSCPHCSKRFRLQKSLRAHVRIHTGEKPFKCEICKLSFISYNALVVHTAKHGSFRHLASERRIIDDN